MEHPVDNPDSFTGQENVTYLSKMPQSHTIQKGV